MTQPAEDGKLLALFPPVPGRRLRGRTLGACVLLAAAAAAFGGAQERRWLSGGPIAFPKLVWLYYAVLAWYVLPFLLARDGRLGAPLRRLYATFCLLMTLRGAVELWLMYGFHLWHPYYGAVQDIIGIALLLLFVRSAKPAHPAGLAARRNVYAIAAMLAAETGFALYFAANFVTTGGGAHYFVPDDPRHSAILRATAAVVACLTCYFPWFFRGWLYGADESGG